ncbi:MAG: hypothetical protein RLZZ268_334, partial [Cyanobacteriota bacterium]
MRPEMLALLQKAHLWQLFLGTDPEMA